MFNRERIVTTLCPHLTEAQAAELRSKAAPWTALIPLRGSQDVFAASANIWNLAWRRLGLSRS